MPLFASLIEEGLRAWKTPCPSQPGSFWWNGNKGRKSQREFEAGTRPVALRALLMYPLNALIEDQLGRIREASDSAGPRQWLRQTLGGHRLWFGRYNGSTPVSGLRDSKPAYQEFRKRMNRMESEWRAAEASAPNDPRILSFFQDPSGAEMWGRWDMQEAPPDILITNYSMLNIMLMRDVEAPIFEATKQWLRESRENVFHLIVDELHTYRGTAGTEVAYLMRAFLHRIGLEPDSPQLRIIATSASIENDPESLRYLEGFFGRSQSDFEVLSGSPRGYGAPQVGLPLASLAPAFSVFRAQVDEDPTGAANDLLAAVSGSQASQPIEQALHSALDAVGAYEAVRQAAPRPRTAAELAQVLFGGVQVLGSTPTPPTSGQQSAMQGLIRAMVLARLPGSQGGGAPLPVRVHLFFHNAGRLWACVDPNCSQCNGRNTPPGEPSPPVGRIYTEPRPRCECGARVLELLYCEPCGEVFVGGYKSADDEPNTWNLSPDFADLERVPDRAASLNRTYGGYQVFWPSQGERTIKDDKADWEWSSSGGSYAWRTARLEPTLGQVRLKWNGAGSDEIKGYLYEAPDDACAGLPHRCPQCGEDWVKRRGVTSPVRDLGSGFQRIVQLLTDSMLRQMDSDQERKLVLFSDSRQDAAKLSTGVKRAHYLDTLRQVAFRCLSQAAASAQDAYDNRQQIFQEAQQLLGIQQRMMQGQAQADDIAAFSTLTASLSSQPNGPAAMAQVLAYAPTRLADPNAPLPAALQPPASPPAWTPLPFDQLMVFASDRLLSIGMNPGGMQPSVAVYRPPVPEGQRSEASLWKDLVDWGTSAPEFRSIADKNDPRAIHIGLIRASLRASLLQDVLFAAGSRDFESLKLGLLWVKNTPPQGVDEEIAAGVLRLLARRRRFPFNPNAQGKTSPPQYVTAYLRAIEEKSGASGTQLTQRVNERARQVLDFFGAKVNQWIVQPNALFVLSPRPNSSGCVDVYSCTRCGRAHLHQAGGVCIICRKALPAATAVDVSLITDYYEFLARSPQPEFRLNCQELTGQTNSDDRRLRQRLFQEVFMQGEAAKADGVDLLSVTTTMEAGVDIGALQGIGMANMPPVRFNYQQRVGRAGRRGRGLSAALTLCRGRSHDDYYFERPQLITSESPPKPYVDLKRESIARRVVNKEVLRRAFSGKPVPSDESERGGDNVHGEFGSVAAWSSTSRAYVESWINSPQNASVIQEVCEAILRRSNLSDLPIAQSMAAMAAWVQNGLLLEIDAKAALTGPQESPSLSQRLASHGVLPMFGFPTRVRLLYHAWPQARGESGTVDREIQIAIGQFAPGAQTVKDDYLLTSVGVVQYQQSSEGFDEVPEPLRDPVPIGVCRRCQALVTPPAPGPCPICSAALGEDGYTVMDANEPPGFCTIYAHSNKAEFEGAFEFAPRALSARLGTLPSANQIVGVVGNAAIASMEQARVYRINDNGGKGFNFRKMQGREVWFVEEAVEQSVKTLSDTEQKTAFRPKADANAPTLLRALAAISTTDVMTVGLSQVPTGLSLNPSRDEARAAWYSFGFLLRRAAAVSLDINENEIDMGLQPFKDSSVPFDPPSARIFLSDKLENGAGYSTYFADPVRFENLLRLMLGQTPVGGQGNSNSDAGRFYDPLAASIHRDECASSCPRCLREFGNMAYHSLLDWRLALDMARLALDPNAPIDLEQPLWSPLLDTQAPGLFDGFNLQGQQFGSLRAGVDVDSDDAFLLVHPLWDTKPANWGQALAEAVAEVEAEGLKPHLWSLFRAVRFPFELPT